MDKKEILDKNKKQNRNSLDEREQKIYNTSFGVGAVIVGVLCLVFSVYRLCHHQMFYEFAAIITAYLCTYSRGAVFQKAFLRQTAGSW